MTGAGAQGKNKCPLKAPSDQEFGEICHPGATGHAGGAEQPALEGRGRRPRRLVQNVLETLARLVGRRLELAYDRGDALGDAKVEVALGDCHVE